MLPLYGDCPVCGTECVLNDYVEKSSCQCGNKYWYDEIDMGDDIWPLIIWEKERMAQLENK